MLPYDHDIGHHGDGGEAEESETKVDGKNNEDGDFRTLPAHKSEEIGDDFDNGQGGNPQQHDQNVPEPPSPRDQQTKSVDPDGPEQLRRSKTPPAPPHLESNLSPSRVDQPSYQSLSPPELPGPHQPQATLIPVGPEVSQIIATSMNAEMQQYALFHAGQVLAQ